jgi:hypothetical protein
MGSLTLDNFDFNKATLTKDHKAMLAAQAKQITMLLDQYPDSFISIAGHTDAVGTEDNNQELGQRRADAVLAELTADGIPPEMMRASSLGETALAVKSKTAEPRNRRVEVFFHARNFNRPHLDFGKLKAPSLDLPGEKAPDKKFDLSMRNPTIPGEKWTPPVLSPSGPFPKTTQQNPLDMTPKGGAPSKSVNERVFEKVDELINPLIKKLPPVVQKGLRAAAHSAIEKGESFILDQALDKTSLDKNSRDAVHKAFEFGLELKF